MKKINYNYSGQSIVTALKTGRRLRIRNFFFFIVFSAGAICCHAQAPAEGFVFVDSNGNGTKDENERGVKGVTVSDQVNVTVTDNAGHYKITATGGNGFIMISVPDGFKTTTNFWVKQDTGLGKLDFPLTGLPPATSFRFVHASDTHISEKSVNRMEKFRAKLDSIKPDLVLITGDLVRDALRVSEQEASSYYKLFKVEAGKIKSPVWVVPGNHEIFGIERHLSLVSKDNPLYGRKMYQSFFGPDYYSFNYGGIHFVGLNSLEFDDLFYYGSIDSVQREWLKRDLSVLPASMPVVTFQHVPFLTGGLSLEPFEEDGPGRTLERERGKLKFRHVVSNAYDVIALLLTHPYPLALAGHYHSRQLFFLETLGQQIRFEQTAAIVSPTEAGIFRMSSGFTLYQVKNGKIDAGTFVHLNEK